MSAVVPISSKCRANVKMVIFEIKCERHLLRILNIIPPWSLVGWVQHHLI